MIISKQEVSYETIHTIVTWADNNNLPPELLIAMCYGESSLNLYAKAETQYERSYGGFQININAHGNIPSHWTGLEGLVRSMDNMKSRWVSTFNTLGSWDAWILDTVAFLCKFWPIAQGSVQPSIDRCEEAAAVGHVAYIWYLKGELK